MSNPRIDTNGLMHRGVAALRNGEMLAARRAFEQIAAAPGAAAVVYFCLAHACNGLRDTGAAMVAIDRALALDPADHQILLLKADLLAAAGEARAAGAYYRSALDGAPPAAALNEAMRQELVRAQAMCDGYAAQFEQVLLERLGAAGLDQDRACARFAHSLDLLLGKKQIYHQNPRQYYFPGLPQVQYFEREEFPWLDRVEAATAEIRQELLAVMAQDQAFEPYLKPDPSRPARQRNGLFNNPAWSAFYLWKNGEFMADNAARCPRTMAALADVPLSAVPGRSPSVLFSLLQPGAHIPPHHGVLNTRLIVHLPLIVPPGCSLRVGNQTRDWEEGKAWVFDDSIEHEAWNRSDQTRVILLFEVWRPELSERERTLVSAMLQSIEAGSDN